MTATSASGGTPTAATQARYRVIVRALRTAAGTLLVDGDWERYEGSLDGEVAFADLGRRRRRLERQGAPSVSTFRDGTQRLAELLDEGFALSTPGWKEARGTAIRSRPETHRFYSDLAVLGAPSMRACYDLRSLRLDGRALAFQYGLEDSGTYSVRQGWILTQASRAALHRRDY